MNKFDIGITGAFITNNPEHCYCININNVLINMLKNKTVLDLGCGDCSYIKNLKEVGCTVQGYDANPYTEELSNGLGKVADLSQMQNFGKYQWVISFETGEHIPSQFESNFFYNLTNHATEGIILSWAIKGQPGEGHINCQNNDYIIEQMYNRSFLCDFFKSEYLRNQSKLWWFQTNLLVFYRCDKLIK